MTPDYSVQINQAEADKAVIHQKLDAIQQEHGQLQTKSSETKQKLAQVNSKKAALDAQIKEFMRVEMRLKKKKMDLEELKQERCDPEEEKKKWIAAIQNKNILRIQHLESFATETEKTHSEYIQLHCMQIEKKCCEEEFKDAQSRKEAIQARNRQLRVDLDNAKDEARTKKRRYDAVKAQASQQYPRREHESKWSEEDKKMSSEDIESQINRLDGRINVLFIDPERVQRYKRLEQKIDKQGKRLEALLNKQSDKEGKINEIENKWRPQLQEAVRKISVKFGEFFRQFNNAEVWIVCVLCVCTLCMHYVNGYLLF